MRGERQRGTRLVDAFDIDDLPRGATSRVMVEIVHDAFGQPVHLPMLVARGERPGPVVGLTAAVHGNEINGIPVIHRLFDWLDPRRIRGAVAAVCVVNVFGYELNRRVFSDGHDLNHLMPGRPDGNVGQIFAHRLIDRIVRHFDYLLDLHTASSGRANSLYVRADMKNEVTAQMAYLQRPQIIVDNPASDRTLRGRAAELGIPAITVEIGDPQRFQSEYIRRSLTGIRAVLSEVGIVQRRPVNPGPAPILCERSYWIYADQGGLLEVYPHVTESVQKGQKIGRLSNIFGDIVREYEAPEDGVIIGKSVNPVGITGARVVHLGIEAPRDRYPAFVPRPRSGSRV